MFFIAYTFNGQVHVFAGRVKIVSHTSCRTSAIFIYWIIIPLNLYTELKTFVHSWVMGVGGGWGSRTPMENHKWAKVAIGFLRNSGTDPYLETIEPMIIQRRQKGLLWSKLWKKGAFTLWSKCSLFHNIFKYMIFQRPQKALLWSKGLRFWYNVLISHIYILGSLQFLEEIQHWQLFSRIYVQLRGKKYYGNRRQWMG